MQRKVALLVIVCLVVGWLLAGTAWGLPLSEGEEILRQVDLVMRSESKEMVEEMTLISANGQQRRREIQMWNSRSDGSDRMLVRFLSPADVRGTGMLVVDDDMWLYLPALGRVRRIAGHAKKGSFMGSDLSYQDMEQLGTKGFSANYQAQLMETTDYEDRLTYHLKLEPRQSGEYSRLEMWIDAERYLPRRIEYFDTDGELIKVLTTHDLTLVDGRWLAESMEMADQQKGSRTVLKVKSVQFDQEIDASLFTTRTLERGI